MRLNSTAIESASYVLTEELLTLHMRDGTTVEYLDCPLATFAGLIYAPSPGGYYNRYIRRGFRSSQRS